MARVKLTKIQPRAGGEDVDINAGGGWLVGDDQAEGQRDEGKRG